MGLLLLQVRLHVAAASALRVSCVQDLQGSERGEGGMGVYESIFVESMSTFNV